MSETAPAALKLSDFLPFRLSVLSNTISRRIAERYQAAFGLAMPQWRVMAVLGETPHLNATKVAERTAMDKVAVSRAVSALVSRGFVRRLAVPDDGRRAALALTAEGEAVYARIVPMALEMERDVTAALSAAERDALEALLLKCAQGAADGEALW